MKTKKNVFVSALIVAAGKGTRMNMDINKQYIEVSGIPVLVRTLKAFEDCAMVNEIVLVVNEADILYCKQEIVDKFRLQKVKCIVAGGKERQESVYNGLVEVDNNADVVAIHDGARPFVTGMNIIDSINGALECGAACVAVPVKDTIKVVDANNFIENTPDRKSLWAIQTPQTFRYGLIMEAHRKAKSESFTGTDDAVLAERAGARVKLVKGNYLNIKITTQEDLILSEAIINLQELQ